MDKLIVVDYHEGAGGEFIARFLSAHFSHELEFDQQQYPNHVQKWLNSKSIITPNWDKQFLTYLNMFLSNCRAHLATSIAVPYHLYKWPGHVDIISTSIPGTRFVKIDSSKHQQRIADEFRRKVLDRPITNFQELQFLLANKDRDFIKSMLDLYKQNILTYRDVFPKIPTLGPLPSNDIEISYEDFFVDLAKTPAAYEKLCSDLEITPDVVLLSALIERNKKNNQDYERHLSKA